MDCGKSERLIRQRVLGLLTPAQTSELERHCASCAACRDGFRDLARLWDGLKAVPGPGPRDDLAQRVLDRIAARTAPAPARWSGAWSWASAMASLTLVLFSWLVWSTPKLPVVDYYLLDGRTVKDVVDGATDHYWPETVWLEAEP